MKHLIGLALLTLSLGAATGCTAIDRETDCQSICSAYRDCVDSNYNVASCQNRCVSQAQANSESDRRIDICNACIDNRSCSERVFSCLSECSGIVP